MSFTKAVPKKNIRSRFFVSQCPQEGFIPFHRSAGMQKTISQSLKLSLSFTKEVPEKKHLVAFFFVRNRGPGQSPALLQPAQKE